MAKKELETQQTFNAPIYLIGGVAIAWPLSYWWLLPCHFTPKPGSNRGEECE